MLRIHAAPPPPPKPPERVNRNATHATRAPEPCNVTGRDSRIGEHNFAASLVKFAIGKLADGLDALTPAPALSSSEVERLVRENAPILVFHPDEKNFPADPLEYIEHSELRHHRAIISDETLAGRGEIDPAQLGELDDDQYNFLDLDNFYRQALGRPPDAGGASMAPIHYEVDQGPPFKVTYHVFYAYNDGPLSQNHEGDWERITVDFKQSRGADGAVSYEPDKVHYSAHHNDDKPVSWADAETENGRLLVYVAKGSHANYPGDGNRPTIYDAHPRYTPRQIIPSPEDLGGQAFENLTDDETARDLNGDGRIDARDGAARMDTAQSLLLDVRQQPWYPQEGGGVHWGERGSALNVLKRDDFSGPPGPSEEKGHVG